MRRALKRLMVLVIAGGVTTVAVAWTCAWLLRVPMRMEAGYGRTTADDSGWYVRRYELPGARHCFGTPLDATTDNLEDVPLVDARDWPREYRRPWLPDPAPGIEPESLRVDSRGWPALALESVSVRSVDRGSLGSTIPKVAWGVPWKPQPTAPDVEIVDDGTIVLPLRPVWARFVFDAAVYGLFWGIVALGVSQLRKRVRRLTPGAGLALVLLSVTLGVLATLATTAACAVWIDASARSPVPNVDSALVVHQGKDLHIHRTSKAGASVWGCYAVSRSVTGAASQQKLESIVPSWAGKFLIGESAGESGSIDARGWPRLAMWHGTVWARRQGSRDLIHGLALDPNNRLVLPLMPIWSGFLTNTAFYGGLALVLMFVAVGPSLIKRSIRHRRGRCVECGYDLRGRAAYGRDRCPECGSLFIVSASVVGDAHPTGPRSVTR